MSNTEDFLAKLDYEGGLGPMLEWAGSDILQHFPDLPPDFANLWEDLWESYTNMAIYIEELEDNNN